MKKLFTLFFLLACLIGDGQSIDMTQFFPLKVGNYWVYQDLYHTSKPDTIRIAETKIVGSHTAYSYGGRLLMAIGDSIYDFQSQRNGEIFSVKQFFPSNQQMHFQVMVGGDVLTTRTVTKIEGAYQCNRKKYFDCYEFDGDNEKIIIARGVGIIERKTSMHFFCLVDYKLE